MSAQVLERLLVALQRLHHAVLAVIEIGLVAGQAGQAQAVALGGQDLPRLAGGFESFLVAAKVSEHVQRAAQGDRDLGLRLPQPEAFEGLKVELPGLLGSSAQVDDVSRGPERQTSRQVVVDGFGEPARRARQPLGLA